MARPIAGSDLQIALAQYSEKIVRPRSTVLFRRGEPSFGSFIIYRGAVSLDVGVDSTFANSYGPGATIGLPETLTRRPYSMTATVTRDAELGFWSLEILDGLLRRTPELCERLLILLGETLAEAQGMQKVLLRKHARGT